ncbi:MAG: polymerase sigma-70 factor [Bacteroidetes bacterium]|jgi:RNA polymerase sigma-70 factor (family 1)|nr:polymerase sigma-70 factor [Bacteroidota bacterium]
MVSSDKNITERLRNDDKSVIDDIFKSYHSRIFRFSLSYLKNDNDAYDIVQEVFIKIWENRLTLKPETNFDAFVFTISRNAVHSLFRKKLCEQKYLSYLSEMAVSNSQDTEQQTDFVFLEQKYEELIENLPSKRKEIFLLSRKSGLTNKEIAKKQGISEKTVEDHLTKALMYLKKQLSAYGVWMVLFYFLFVE